MTPPNLARATSTTSPHAARAIVLFTALVQAACFVSDPGEPTAPWTLEGDDKVDMSTQPLADMRVDPPAQDMRTPAPIEEDMKLPPEISVDMRGELEPDMKVEEPDMRGEEEADMRAEADMSPPTYPSDAYLSCPNGSRNSSGCSGNLIAMGSMNNSDSPSQAATYCQNAGDLTGTCCSFHLYGVGEWFLTDGAPIDSGGVPYESAGGRGAWSCQVEVPRATCNFDPMYCSDAENYAPEPGYFHVGVWDSGSCAGSDTDVCPDSPVFHGESLAGECSPGETYRCETARVSSDCVLEYSYHYCD